MEIDVNIRWRVSLPLALLAGVVAAAPAWSQNVKITPLGSHTGELCSLDRALILEDPTGVRILYDAGQSVTGSADPRLGTIHIVLLSHAHGDHIGDRKMSAQNAGTCDKPETISAAPNSTTAEIVAAKNAATMMVGDLGAFIGKKVENIRGKPTAACVDNVVPYTEPCLANAQPGGKRTFKTASATQALEITLVPASHANNVPRSLLTEPERKNLDADEVSFALGPPIGYVIKFTNGLVVYLSGDTGIHADMRVVVHDFHKANLAVLNLGPSAVSPEAAAFIVNELVQPAAVIVSHPNEAVTADGRISPNSRAKAVVDLVKGRPVYLARSGKTMEFDASAKCVSGC
jgi:L-ascorbate metabolism protein UlaG (beta-lactamase superfamily)